MCDLRNDGHTCMDERYFSDKPRDFMAEKLDTHGSPTWEEN